MSARHVLFEVSEGVATLTLNRPEQRNTFTARMGEELGEAYRACDGDDGIRAVVLTGAGDCFCAGADLSAGEQTFGAPQGASFSASPVAMQAFEVRKPVIAALNGHAIGIGLTLALQCDLRLVAADAKYGVVQVRRGVMPDCAAHWTLPRLIGMARAIEVLLTGRKFSGEEAFELGIATRCLPRANVLPAATDLARELAREASPLSLAVTKRLLWESGELSAGQVMRYETELHQELMGRPDAIEGVMAFLERRTPRWTSSVSGDWPAWPDPQPESEEAG